MHFSQRARRLRSTFLLHRVAATTIPRDSHLSFHNVIILPYNL